MAKQSAVLKPVDLAGLVKWQTTVVHEAKRCMRACKNDVVQAADMMYEAVWTDDKLWKALTEPLLEQACVDACRGVIMDQRRKFPPAAKYDPHVNDESNDRAVSLIVAQTRELMEFPLPGGLRLGDARKAEVQKAADAYTKQAHTMGIRGTWLENIAAKLSDDQTVEEKFTEKALAALFKRAEKRHAD